VKKGNEMATRWNLFKKRHAGKGRYSHYYNSTVVVVSNNRGFLLTPAITKLLGEPKRALLLNDNNGNLGIRPVKENDPEWNNAFSIILPSGSSSKGGMRLINCRSYIKEYKVQIKAVFTTVSIENGILVVNLNQYEPLIINN
jgi:hypothetical protein